MNVAKSDNVYKLLVENNFERNENVPERLKCSKCRRILINACQGPCGCRYCRVCVNDLTMSGCQICPGNTDDCRETNLSIFQTDYSVNMEISKLVVKCPSEMCTFENELININEHLRVCPNKRLKCVFYDLGCAKENMVVTNINEHLQSENHSHMTMLIGIIDNLKNEVNRLKEGDVRNKNEIDRLKENDERNRNEIDRLEEKDERNRNEIELLKENDERNRNEIERLKESDERKRNEIQILKGSDERNRNEIGILKQDLVMELSTMRQSQCKIDDKCGETNSINQEINLITEQKIDDLRNEIERTDGRIDLELGKIRQEWRDIIHINEAMANTTIDTYQMNIENRIGVAEKWIFKQIDGTFLWGVNEINKRRDHKKNIRSEYFYARAQPYKMALRLDLNRDDVIDDTGLGIKLYIYDDDRNKYFTWPFKANVTIKILNRAKPNVCKMITTKCIIDKPTDYSYKNSDWFDFSYSELTNDSLLIGDCFMVECNIDL